MSWEKVHMICLFFVFIVCIGCNWLECVKYELFRYNFFAGRSIWW